MLFIWRGLGFLVIVLPLAALVIIQLAVNSVYGDGTYEEAYNIYGSIGLVLGSLLLFLIGQKRSRIVTNAPLSSKFLRTKDSFFFLDIRIWALVVAIFGVVVYLA